LTSVERFRHATLSTDRKMLHAAAKTLGRFHRRSRLTRNHPRRSNSPQAVCLEERRVLLPSA
jgi:hypothetical protein